MAEEKQARKFKGELVDRLEEVWLQAAGSQIKAFAVVAITKTTNDKDGFIQTFGFKKQRAGAKLLGHLELLKADLIDSINGNDIVIIDDDEDDSAPAPAPEPVPE